MTNFEQAIRDNPVVLMEAAIVERLRRNPEISLHPRLANSLLIYDEKGRAELTRYYSEYLAIARQNKLPMILCTPTWRANRQRVQEAQIASDLNGDAVAFMRAFSDAYIGGLIGCKNDCYKPEEALSTEEATEFHAWQISRLQDADYLLAVTLPELGEALGIAQAMACTALPYIISFVINRNGTLLDGHSLEEAITTIDSEAVRPPLGYMINCAYPSFLHPDQLSDEITQRLIGYQANASSLDHTALDGADELAQDDLMDWTDRMQELHRSLGLTILGGCCGTGAAHLDHLAHKLV